jgi:hypothetical protein
MRISLHWLRLCLFAFSALLPVAVHSSVGLRATGKSQPILENLSFYSLHHARFNGFVVASVFLQVVAGGEYAF